MSKREKLFLFDGNSFMHRAYNSMPAFSNKAGHPTGVITGFLNMMVSVLNRYQPEKSIVNFDHKGKNFRHEIFSDYKGTRKPTEPELKQQFQPVKDILTAWGFPIVSVEGYEADDTMGTLAVIGVEQGYDVYIVTSDKDMCQLVGEHIFILDTKDADKKGKPLDSDGVFEKMGVYPHQIIDLLAIMGDKSDNVPGAEGVGPVTAAKWLSQYQSLEKVIEHADELKGAYGEKFRNQIDQVKLSYKLVTINSNANLGIEFNNIVGERNDEKLFALIKEFELKKFQLAIGAKNTDAENVDVNIIDLDSEQCSLDAVLDSKELFVETHEHNGSLLLFLAKNDDENIYKITVNKEIASKILSHACLASNDVKKAIKLLSSLAEVRINPLMKVMDSRVFNYNINGGSTKPVGIDVINQIHANIELSELRVTNKLDTEKPQWNKLQFEELLLIKAEEVVVAKQTLLSELHLAELNSNSLCLDYQLIPVISLMEMDGVYIDKSKLEELNVVLSAKLGDLECEIFKLAGKTFNIASPKQVQEVLFVDLEIPSKKKSTNEKEMNKLAGDYPIVSLILEWRSLSKNISTYIIGIINRLDENGLVHAEFNQTVATTGRLSAKDPNLQSIPVASEDGRKVREAFVARLGRKIVALDYSQIEMRIMAHLSGQPELIKAFVENLDVHAATASDVFGVSIEDVSLEQRRAAKAVNFGLIYGRGAKALAGDLGIAIKDAKAYIDAYFDRYDLVKPCMESILVFAKENLYVETVIGRKLLTRDVNTTNPMVRPHAELSAKNAPLQGTAADIVKQAMIDVAKYIFENSLSSKITLLMQVHDELVFEIDEDIVEDIAPILASIMVNASKLSVPLEVDYKIADNWSDAH